MVFVNVTATTEIYTDLHTLSLHDALPIYQSRCASSSRRSDTEIQTARRRPLSQLSRMMPATWRPLPAPVPSPRNHPRRNFTASSASSGAAVTTRSEEHTSELQSLMLLSYAVFFFSTTIFYLSFFFPLFFPSSLFS